LLLMAIIAAAGESVFLLGEARHDAAHAVPVNVIPMREDLKADLGAANALVSGRPAAPWFGDFSGRGYRSDQTVGHAPQFVLLLAPLGLLPPGVAYLLARLLAALLTIGALLAWARGPDGRVPPWAWIFLFSIAVVTLVRLDQLMTAVGLAGLTLALLAQRRDRWFLVGVGCALGLVRTTNALPVVAMLLVALWGRPRQMSWAFLGGLAVLGPLTLLVQVWDPNWLRDYGHNLTLYPSVGPVALLRDAFGVAGSIGAAVVASILAAALVWRDRGRALDLDRASLGLAVGVAATIVSAAYVGIFAIPALIRVAMRPGLRAVAWVVTAIPWAVVIVTAPTLLSASPAFNPDFLSTMSLVMIVAAYPLLRRARSVEPQGQG
jgi:hypothetical protein